MYYEIDGEIPIQIPPKLIELTLEFAADYLSVPFDTWLLISFDQFETADAYIYDIDLDEKLLDVSFNNELNRERFVIAVLHEMVHVAQIVSGRLIQQAENVWEGAVWKGSTYHEYPWEVEAFHLEHDMHQQIINRRWYAGLVGLADHRAGSEQHHRDVDPC